MPTYDDLFYMGYMFHSLVNLDEDRVVKPASKDFTVLWSVNKIEELLEDSEVYDKALLDLVSECKAKLDKYKAEEKIASDDLEYIQEEFGGIWRHFVNDTLRSKRIRTEEFDLTINPDMLHLGVEGFFTSGIRKKFSKVEKEDMEDSMDSLLLGNWTLSVMIGLRAVEGVLRKFYKKTTGKGPILTNGSFLNWGSMIKELKDQQYSADEELMVNLDYLNRRRNEAQHPDKRFSKEIAESTFHKAVEAMRIMAV